MAFSEEFNTGTPQGTEAPNQGDNRIREAKAALLERLQVEHDFQDQDTGGEVTPDPTDNIGRHKTVSLIKRSADPNELEDIVILYSKEVDSAVELFAMFEDGTAVQLSSGGKINLTVFEGNYTLLDEQESAPTTAENQGGLYTKDVDGETELFYRESSNGDEIQLTSGGKLNLTVFQGTKVLLTETTAPATAENQGALYTKEAGGQTELFFREESSGDELQLTEDGGAGVGFKSRVRVTRSANQSIPAQTTDKVEFNTEDYDELSEWNVTTYRFTALAAGRYMISSTVGWAETGISIKFTIAIYKNGVSFSSRAQVVVADLPEQGISITDILELAASDYIEIFVTNPTAQAREVSSSCSWCAIHRIS